MAAHSSAPARPALNIMVETEKNLKEKKLYPVRERPFHPNLSEKPLSGKFYAKHEFVDVSIEFSDLEEAIERRQASKPKDRAKNPETVNQEYGWYLEPLLDVDKSDPRFHHPKITSWITQIGVLIDLEAKKVPKKPFTVIHSTSSLYLWTVTDRGQARFLYYNKFYQQKEG